MNTPNGSGKFALFVLVALIVVIGVFMFPSFNTMLGTVNTTGLSTQMVGIEKMFPYFLLGVVGYAAYCVYKNRSGGG